MNDQFVLDPAMTPIIDAVLETLGERRLILIGGAVLTGYAFIKRTTDDLDLCVMADDDEPASILAASTQWARKDGFAVRWVHVVHGWQIDVLPLRPADESDLHLSTGRVLSRAGMGQLHTVAHSVAGLPAHVQCAPVFAIALLKMNAWVNAPLRRGKDLPDVRQVLKNYEGLTDRLFDLWHDHQSVELCDMEQFGAYLLGQDMARIASPAAARAVREFVRRNTVAPDDAHDPNDAFVRLLPWLLTGFEAGL